MTLPKQLIERTHRYRNAAAETRDAKKGLRKAPGDFLRAATTAGASALIVTTISAARWAGWAMTASDSGARRGVRASPSPVNVKYFLVPPPGKAAAESLYDIAAKTLGDGSRYTEIFALNKGRLQLGGGRLEDPDLIEPGWILGLPADATGPGVHFGPLPTMTMKATPGVTPSPSVSPPRPAVVNAWAADSLAGQALAAGGVLIVLTAAVMTATYGRRRVGRRHSGMHARAPGRGAAGTIDSVADPLPQEKPAEDGGYWATGDPWMSPADPPRPDAAPRVLEDDHPSWPGRPGPYALHPDHPSWPGRPDPRWAATEAVLRPNDHPRWPEHQVQPEAPLAWPEADRGWPEPGQIWDVGSVQLASWILTEANQQATEIKHEASDQAATSLADARHEADEVMRRASDQAAATLEAAERHAAEVRATVTRLSVELSGVAAHVTESLLSPALAPTPAIAPATTPAIRPAVQPVTRPAPEPTAEPEARPAVKLAPPGTKPAARPKTQPARPNTRPDARPKTRRAAKPKSRTRQKVAIRAAAVVAAVLVLFALVSGITEVALHGLPFFVFRAVGTGETGPNGLKEDQGPGQPDAPKPTPAAHQHLHNP
jgi:hypothetical protein